MAQISVGDPHGLYKVYVGLVDSSGYNYGQAGTGVANGTLISPYQIKQAKNATMPVPDRTVIDFTGGDVWTGAYVYGFTSLGQGDLDTATIDADLIALVGGSAADNTTNTRTMMFAENVNKSIPPQVFEQSPRYRKFRARVQQRFGSNPSLEPSASPTTRIQSYCAPTSSP